jgi:hypothetical protein
MKGRLCNENSVNILDICVCVCVWVVVVVLGFEPRAVGLVGWHSISCAAPLAVTSISC